MTEVLSICKPLEIGVGLAEKLEFHLLEFTYTEYKIAGGYLVAEAFAYLTYAEGKLFAGCALYVLEIDKYALCGLGTKIHG